MHLPSSVGRGRRSGCRSRVGRRDHKRGSARKGFGGNVIGRNKVLAPGPGHSKSDRRDRQLRKCPLMLSSDGKFFAASKRSALGSSRKNATLIATQPRRDRRLRAHAFAELVDDPGNGPSAWEAGGFFFFKVMAGKPGL